MAAFRDNVDGKGSRWRSGFINESFFLFVRNREPRHLSKWGKWKGWMERRSLALSLRCVVEEDAGQFKGQSKNVEKWDLCRFHDTCPELNEVLLRY
jgi:hypothetical protein